MLPLKTQVAGRRLSRGCHRCKLEIELADTCSMYMQLCSHPGCGPSAHTRRYICAHGGRRRGKRNGPHCMQSRGFCTPAAPTQQGRLAFQCPQHTQKVRVVPVHIHRWQPTAACTDKHHPKRACCALYSGTCSPTMTNHTHKGTLCQTLHVCK